MRLLLAAAAAAFAMPAVVSASPVTLAVTGGTLGVGPEVSYRIAPLLAVRGSATFLGVTGHGSTGGYRYEGHAHLANWGGTVDVHPFANGFRLSAGARYTGNDRIRLRGMSKTNVTYGPMVFTPEQAGVITSTIHTRSVSPIATIGYSRSSLSGFTFGLDAGAMFHGTPSACCYSATGELSSNPIAQADYADQMAHIRHAIHGYHVYPVLQASLGYRF
jgi:hypothetical protein